MFKATTGVIALILAAAFGFASCSAPTETEASKPKPQDAQLERLLEAFGGKEALQKIRTVSYRLAITRGDDTSVEDVFVDFSDNRIGVRPLGQSEWRVAGEGLDAEDTSLSDGEREELLGTLQANFLYFLTAPDLRLLEAEGVPGEGTFDWVRMEARGQTSQVMGLDPENGRIVRVLGGPGVVVREFDYQPHNGGLIWPNRFEVRREGQLVLEGRFSQMRVNPPDIFSGP